jgi:hypothetical protein
MQERCFLCVCNNGTRPCGIDICVITDLRSWKGAHCGMHRPFAFTAWFMSCNPGKEALNLAEAAGLLPSYYEESAPALPVMFERASLKKNKVRASQRRLKGMILYSRESGAFRPLGALLSTKRISTTHSLVTKHLARSLAPCVHPFDTSPVLSFLASAVYRLSSSLQACLLSSSCWAWLP